MPGGLPPFSRIARGPVGAPSTGGGGAAGQSMGGVPGAPGLAPW